MVFDKKVIDFASEPLFLGTGRNVSRLDLNVEQGIQKQTDDAIGKIWFANDFSYTQDGKDYATMSQKLRNLYLKNLKFQTLLDSVASRTVVEVFIPITTNPQLESWWYQHAFFENNIHSKTYAEIIKVMPLDSKVVFDDIMINDNILSRAKEVTEVFNEAVLYNARMTLHNANLPGVDVGYDLEEHQVMIVKSLYALNILEFILFKSSFLTSFAFKENGLMTATGDAIKKIQLDEIGHGAMSTNLINRLRKDPQWIHIFAKIEKDVYKMYQNAITADYAWIDYLFEEDVQLMGINSQVEKQYVDYNAKIVMTSVGLEPFKAEVFNPCIWANKYTKSANVQTAQKEKDNANYLLGKLDTETSQEFWKGLDNVRNEDYRA